MTKETLPWQSAVVSIKNNMHNFWQNCKVVVSKDFGSYVEMSSFGVKSESKTVSSAKHKHPRPHCFIFHT